MTLTAKQLSKWHISNDLEALLELYAEYKSEYDEIADRLMENQQDHNFFFNWLGAKGLDTEQSLVQFLEESGIEVIDDSKPAFSMLSYFTKLSDKV